MSRFSMSLTERLRFFNVKAAGITVLNVCPLCLRRLAFRHRFVEHLITEHKCSKLKARRTKPFNLQEDQLPTTTAMSNPFDHVVNGAKAANYRASNHYQPGNQIQQRAKKTLRLNPPWKLARRKSFGERAATAFKKRRRIKKTTRTERKEAPHEEEDSNDKNYVRRQLFSYAEKKSEDTIKPSTLKLAILPSRKKRRSEEAKSDFHEPLNLIKSDNAELTLTLAVIKTLIEKGLAAGTALHINAQAWPPEAAPILDAFGALELVNPKRNVSFRLNIKKIYRPESLTELGLDRRYDLILCTHAIHE